MKGKRIVKRKGHTEYYDEKKVYASVYAAAINCHYSERRAENLASAVMKKVNRWVTKRKSIASEEIREHIIQSMEDKDVILMYKHHMDIC